MAFNLTLNVRAVLGAMQNLTANEMQNWRRRAPSPPRLPNTPLLLALAQNPLRAHPTSPLTRRRCAFPRIFGCRYEYLHDHHGGRYRNPFDRGVVANLAEFFSKSLGGPFVDWDARYDEARESRRRAPLVSFERLYEALLPRVERAVQWLRARRARRRAAAGGAGGHGARREASRVPPHFSLSPPLSPRLAGAASPRPSRSPNPPPAGHSHNGVLCDGSHGSHFQPGPTGGMVGDFPLYYHLPGAGPPGMPTPLPIHGGLPPPPHGADHGHGHGGHGGHGQGDPPQGYPPPGLVPAAGFGFAPGQALPQRAPMASGGMPPGMPLPAVWQPSSPGPLPHNHPSCGLRSDRTSYRPLCRLASGRPPTQPPIPLPSLSFPRSSLSW